MVIPFNPVGVSPMKEAGGIIAICFFVFALHIKRLAFGIKR